MSIGRERVGVALLALLVASLGVYTLTTRDSAIKRRAIDFIRKSTPGGMEIHVGHAQFKMFEGITLYDVELAVPADDRLDPTARDFKSRRIFSARSLKLAHNPWLLALGKLRVERITAVQPTIYLRHNTETGLRNWQLLTVEKSEAAGSAPAFRPIITLRMARAVVVSIDGSGNRESRVEELDADVRPHPQAETGYYIEVRRYTEPIERATVIFDPGQKMVANTPFVDARTIRLQLPTPARKVFDRIRLEGEVRLTRLLYDTARDQTRDTEIVLRRVQCDVPLQMLESDDPTTQSADDPARDESLVRITDVRGSIKIVGDRISVDASGIINNSPCRIHGAFSNIESEFKNFCVDVTFEARELPMPEGKVRQRMLKKGNDLPLALREFFEDYDPHGKLDAHIHFTREPNAPGTIRTDGRVLTLGMNASTVWFPYPLEDIHGAIRFNGTKITLENLGGRHGCGTVYINAKIDVEPRYSDVVLDIKGTSVPLDIHLYDALPARYQAVLDRFSPRGMAHINARLHRPGGPDDKPRPQWIQQLSIDLLDARATILPHPFPLENLHGRLEVDGDRIRVMGLAGDSRGASMQFDGYALIRDERDIEMDMRVEAAGIQLDERYVAAMPEDVRSELAPFKPQGELDLLGTLSLRENRPSIQWALDARLRDASMCYSDFPYPLNHVEAEIEIANDHLTIKNATGRNGDARISASGEICGGENDPSTVLNLNFDAESVLLDESLADSLPAEMRNIWDLLKPQGHMRVTTGLHIRNADGRNLLAHRTVIEPIDASIVFAGFPLPLSHVNGRVIVHNNRVEILKLTGMSGDAPVSLSGEIAFDGAGAHGTLDIHGRKMRFDSVLVDALPVALRKFVRSIDAQGEFDLNLAPLTFVIDDAGESNWFFDGSMALSSANANLGFKLQQCNGRITGTGTVDKAGGLLLQSSFTAGSVIMAGWHLENLKGQIRTDETGRHLFIDDLSAAMYDGEAAGFAEIELGKTRSNYQVSITARGMQLERYVAIHHPPKTTTPHDEKEPTASGDVSGNIVLRGRTGRNGHSEGAGEFHIREARVWKLPIILAIFQVLNLTPDENVFHDGMLKFYLSNDILTFNKIDLQGKAMSFIGGGVLDLRTDLLDITLLAGSPVRIQIPLLSEILESASREIMEIRLTGTLTDPKIAPMPLKSITAAIKTLFPEPPPSLRETGHSR
ncbi:MAG: AsmA-like C-terminal domain-containing protein [Planctomycetes bacterium]|nr:AsmA-like C-terminal domain-containing protein [Planctomycetota bacterium]